MRPTHISARLLLCVSAVALLAGSCGAKGDDTASPETTDAQGSETKTPAEGDTFGDLASPCGEGEFTVEADQAAGSPDVLRIGVANDRSSQIRPGLNKEIWDASNAFVAWCNDQGGIGGLPIEIVDLDGKLFEVEAAMAKACNDVFMMVGGGFVQDDLEFSGKPGSDFHQCGLADIPAFTVSPQKTDSNGQVQPVPHPSALVTTAQMQMVQALEPEDAESMAVVWADLPSVETIKNQTVAVIDDLGIEPAGVFKHPITGLADWTPLAQEIIGSGAGSFHYVGEPTNLGNLMSTLRGQGWEGTVIAETNMYDQGYVDAAGASAAAGTLIRSMFHPFEEADKWPATKAYMDIVTGNVDKAKIATLGAQSFSAWLLFGTAANDCAAESDNVLTRACILEAAAAIDEWTAGGLHAVMDPSPEGGSPSECEMQITVTEDGSFERLAPEIDGEGDDGDGGGGGDGFSCFEDSLVEVPANDGLGVIGPNQPL